MRIFLPNLLLLLLVVSCLANSFHRSRKDVSASPAPRLYKRQGVSRAKGLFEAEVPERFKTWNIFKDGNSLREKFRTRYIGFLRRIDKIRQPYSYAKDIKKQWIYKPDLRKQYVLPRVLRIPIITQQGPVPYEEEFAAFIKSVDEDSKLKEAAIEHVPSLEEQTGSEAAQLGPQTTVKAGSGRSSSFKEPSQHTSPPRLTSSRRRPHRKAIVRERARSFNQLVPSPPGTPHREILSDDPTQSGQPGQSMSPVNEAETPSAPPPGSSDKEQLEGRNNPMTRLSSALIGMTERFKKLKTFQDEQIKKAAMRYVGHPEYRAPEQQAEKQAVAEPGAGLARIRIKTAKSEEISPDPTPRGANDPTGTDADESNPITPSDRVKWFSDYPDFTNEPFVGGKYPPGRIPLGSGRPETPQPRTPAGYLSPLRSSSHLTPQGSVSSIDGITPGGFQLPADYAELLHAARLQRERKSLQSSAQINAPLPPVSHVRQIETHLDERLNPGWGEGRPSDEGIRRMQELAALNDAGHVIYTDDLPQGEHMPLSPAKIHPLGGPDENSKTSPEVKPQDLSPIDSARLAGRRDTDLLSASRRFTSPTRFRPDMNQKSLANEIEIGREEELQAEPESPGRKDGADQQAGSASIEEESGVPRKRRRPSPLMGPFKNPMDRLGSFFFQTRTPRGETPTPHMAGFKPSLSIQEAPIPNHDPADPNSPKFLVFRRRKQQHMILSTHLQELQEKLKKLRHTDTPATVIYHDLRRSEDAGKVGDPRQTLSAR
ncbi:uncharacterized protein UTRI_02229_B [Ustilago trichophora]|uniref:Uncharacterized protein n=1 Tax=Ustilago trichophora TaxID=86804 RepID=A0A5C3DY93_9BASI|nr:uncharacterized protein UTRI_02229_B [Ustilago trichophora]